MNTYEGDSSSNRYFDYIIIIIICIIFFLVFVIQMTIFDFYKRPSIYELEIYNEFKKKNGCSHPCKSGNCKCNSGGGVMGTEENNTSQNSQNLFTKSYTEANFYKDIIYFIVYVNIMYFSSLFFSDFVLTFIGIILISIMLYIKHFSLKSL